MRILVTGSTGFLGSAVVSKLAECRHSVIAYSSSEKPLRYQREIKHVKGDIFDIARLMEILTKCDAVIHAVGLADARTAQDDPQMSFDLNVRSLQTVLEAMRNIGITRLILPSSSLVYGKVNQLPVKEDVPPNPLDIYGFHKYMAEKLAESYSRTYGVRVNILRLFNVYGIGGSGILSAFVEKALKNEPIRLYGENQKRDFIHISDIVDVFAGVLELEDKFEIYNIGAGTGKTITHIVTLIKECFPALRVESTNFDGISYDSVADINKIKSAISFNPDSSDDKIREVIQEQRKQKQG